MAKSSDSQRNVPRTGQRADTPATAAGDTRELRESALRAATAMAAAKTSYFRMAFANPYNLSLLFGSLSISAMIQSPLLALSTLGAEALWLVYAPGSEWMRRRVWDPQVEAARRAREAAARKARLAVLENPERVRALALIERQRQIQQLAAQNPSFTGDLLRTELQKTDRLVEAYIELALTCARFEQYLRSVDPGELEHDRKRYEATSQSSNDPDQAALAKKNLDVVTKRLARIADIERYLGFARGQLDLIENSFQLIADQIVTMQSPQELSGQLDELLDGVEAIRETAKDTERILGGIDREL